MGQPRRVAVLGASGFIGGHLVTRLRGDGYDVRAVDRRTGQDLRYWGDTQAAISGCDWVFHLAADMGGVGYFHSNADWAASADNARISLNVLRACDEFAVERLFYASSACAYPTQIQQDPTNPPKLAERLLEHGPPDQLYGREKLATLRLCEKAPFDARVGILHTVYGPGQEGSGVRSKFPPAVCVKAIAARHSGRLELWGDGRQMRSYLYIDDAVDRIMTIMTSDDYDGPVNVGYEGAISCRDAAVMAANAAGCDPHIVCNPAAGPSGVQARDCDNSLWRTRYGPTADVHPAEGFARLVAWFGAFT